MSTLKIVVSRKAMTETLNITDLLDVAAKTGSGSTVVMQTSPTITSPTITDVSNMAVQSSTGRKAMDVLRIASDVASAERVRMGVDMYEVEIVNTDSTDDTAGGTWNNTTDPISIVAATYPNVPTTVGSLLRVENEIFRVTATGASLTLARAQSGTTAVAHANALNIYKGDGLAGGSTVAVGLVTTLTPTAFTPALVADANEWAVEEVTLTQISANEVLAVADAVGVVDFVCSDTLAGVNNGWAASAMYGGRAATVRHSELVTRVPTATEVALGNMHFEFAFTPTEVFVRVWPTATPNGVITAWVGATSISSGRVTLDNSGGTDWAATDTVMVLAVGA